MPGAPAAPIVALVRRESIFAGRGRPGPFRFRVLVAGLVAMGCGDAPLNPPVPDGRAALIAEVRSLAAREGLAAMPPAPSVRPALVELGRALAFDKILSGNRDISCMTCHPPAFATGDGRSLAVGQGATGLGPSRTHPEGRFIPRNSPQFFNLHMSGRFFWDGRVEALPGGGFGTPAGDQLTPDMASVFEFGALSAVPLFPVTSRAEMRADGGNELAAIPDGDFTAIWDGLMARLGAVPGYRARFEAAYPGESFDDMTFAHAANAIAGFIVAEFASNDTPWDRFLAGSDEELSEAQLRGARSFVTMRCTRCHTGPGLSDLSFHNIAAPQIGPGEGDGLGTEDFGRERVTGDPDDRYLFRTPLLRNVELTAPYGHAGQFADLPAIVSHYDDIDRRLAEYDVSQLEPALRNTLVHNYGALLTTRDTILEGVEFDERVAADLVSFLGALTDERARSLFHVIPEAVPSGLPVDR